MTSSGPIMRMLRLFAGKEKACAKSNLQPALQSKVAGREAQKKIWQAARPKIAGKLWGEGHHLPCANRLIPLLIRPFGLNAEMSVLDLSAGLGGAARRIFMDSKAYVTGLESAPDLAEAGMEISRLNGMALSAPIEFYDPETYTPSRKYDCVIARDLFFRVRGKDRFMQAIADTLKPRGHMSWTDYVVDPAAAHQSGIRVWAASELDGDTPPSLPNVMQTMTRLGFDVRIHEDVTQGYRHHIQTALQRFARFIAPYDFSEATRTAIIQETELWARRGLALEQGMKVCRFYALKK